VKREESTMQDQQPTDGQRRRFSRIRFESGARLCCGGRSDDCEVRDLSLKGALVSVAQGQLPPVGEPCTLELALDNAATIRIEGEIAHAGDGRVGLVCREIDLDSITHLRRLLELNLGDCELLNRELSALLAD
jgi:PilZ domain-containing protein